MYFFKNILFFPITIYLPFLNCSKSFTFSPIPNIDKRVIDECITGAHLVVLRSNNCEEMHLGLISRLSALVPTFLIGSNPLPISDHLADALIAVYHRLDIFDIFSELDHWRTSGFWNAQAKYLFVFTHTESQEDIQRFIQMTWMKKKMLNVAVSVLNPDNMTYQVWNWNPFSGGNISQVSSGSSIFPDKLLNILQFPLRVSSLTIPSARSFSLNGEFYGPDNDIIRMLATYLNAKLVMFPPIDENPGSEGVPPTGSIADLIEGRADIVANRRFIIMQPINIQFTYPEDLDQLNIIVPKVMIWPLYQYLWRSFTLFSWFAIFITILIYFVLSYYCNKRRGTLILDYWGVFFSQSIKFPNTGISRFCLISFVWFSLIITSSYQGSLLSSITSPNMPPNIDSFKELLDTNLPILSHKSLENKISLDNSTSELLKRMIYFTQLKDEIDSRQNEKLALVFDSTLIKNFLSFRKNFKYGVPKYHLIKQSLGTFPVGYAVSRDCPFLLSFNKVILKSISSGLNQYWSNNLKHHFYIKGQISDESLEKKYPKPFKLHHIGSIFYLLLYGLIISFIVFFFEIQIKRKSKLFY